MSSVLSLILVGSLMSGALPQNLPQIELRDRLTRGDAIGVEMKNGRRITGAVGDAQWDGFWVEHPPGEATFVSFRNARAVLDPDTGLAIGLVAHDRDRNRWVKPTVIITVTAVTVLVVATKGLFPMCLFVTCFR